MPMAKPRNVARMMPMTPTISVLISPTRNARALVLALAVNSIGRCEMSNPAMRSRKAKPDETFCSLSRSMALVEAA